jgi:hypothetical protein
MACVRSVGGCRVVSWWSRVWKGTGRREVESKKKAWWLWFSGGRKFETRQWRELGESGDLSFMGKSRCLFGSYITLM